MSCHPVLKTSIEKQEHLVLKTCIECHSDLSQTQGMTQCGGDCFSCHSKEKLSLDKLVQHQELKGCKDCHIDKKELLKFPSTNYNSNFTDLLK